MAKHNHTDALIAIRPKRMAPFILPHMRWLIGLSPDVRCPVCGRFRDDVYPRIIDVTLFQLARGLACGFMSDFNIGIIRTEFFADLGLDKHEFAVGRCFKGTGELIKTYVSYYSRPRIGCYGTEANVKTVCSGCGHFWVEDEGERFVLASEVGDRAAVQDQAGHLYLAPRLAARIDWQKHRSIQPFTYPIRKTASSVRAIQVEYVGKEYFKYKPELITKPGSICWGDWAHSRR